MIFLEKDKKTAATCGIIVNQEYILWTSWTNGDLYKLNLHDYHIEFLKNTIEAGHCGKAFSYMLRFKEKVYLICLYDCYEIMEYNIQSGRLRLLYQHQKEGIEIFYAFLMDGYLYLFPDKTSHNICVYSLETDKTVYIEWKKWFLDVDLDIEDKFIYSIYGLQNRIYGAIYKTPYIFQIEVQPEIKCRVYKLGQSCKLGNIYSNQDGLYAVLMDRNAIIRLDQNMNMKTEWRMGENDQKENMNHLPLVAFLINNKEIICFPFDNKDKIRVIHTNTGEQKIVEYPDEFCVRDSDERLFWNPVVAGNKVYLLPHCGNGMLVLNMDSYKLEYVDLKMDLYHQIKKSISINDKEDQRKDSEKNIGNLIYCAGKG